MRKLGWMVVMVLVLALAAAAVVYAQGRTQVIAASPVQMAQAPGAGGPPMGRFGQMSDAERAKMREQMLERVLSQAGLTDKEKAAAKKAMTAKEQARRELTSELANLERVASGAKPTDKQLSDALSAYHRALAKYRKAVAADDAALVKQLSLKSQARCTAMGILDNGLGFGGGRMGMGGRMRGAGGFGGGRPRGS
jgi:hypothetical protein